MGLPKVTQLQSNFFQADLPNGVVYISYKTPVALEVEGENRIEYVRRKQFFSVTTSRHLNKYCRAYRQVDEAEWARLLAWVLGEQAPVAVTETADEKFRRYIDLR